ncbi:MAG: hypothetical protein ACRD2E_11560 [Terriglobales bacterium]
MALPVLTFAVNDYPAGKDQTHSKVIAYGTLTITTGGSYVTGGIPLSFTGYEFAPIATGTGEPIFAQFQSPTSGYQYVFDSTNQTLRIFEGAAAVSEPLAELANNASVAADVLQFRAEFNKG